MVFAREISDPLTSLVKKIDAATAENKACKMGSFFVFCSDDEKLEKKLKEISDKEKLKDTVLTIESAAGPSGYDIAKDADVTVILYSKKNVKVNLAYRKGELKDADVDKIVADIQQILPEKKSK
jgi:hypothetical protein